MKQKEDDRLRGSALLIALTILIFMSSYIQGVCAVTVYYWDYCDDLDNWSIHADLNPAIDVSRYKTENASLALMETDYEAYDRHANWTGVLINEDSGAEVLGFWVWCNSTREYDTRTLFAVRIYDGDSGHWHIFYVIWSDDHSQFEMGQGYTGSGVSEPVQFHMERWYWVQMWQNGGTNPRCDVYDNTSDIRVYSHEKAGASYPIDNGSISIYCATDRKISHLTSEYAIFDHFRIANEPEYPPYYGPPIEGAISIARLGLIFMLVGLGLVFGPPFMLANDVKTKRAKAEKIIVYIMLMIIGAGLLMGLSGSEWLT